MSYLCINAQIRGCCYLPIDSCTHLCRLNNHNFVDFSSTIFHRPHSSSHSSPLNAANCPVSRQQTREQIFKLWACKRRHWEGSIVSIKSNFLSDHLLSKHAILPTDPLWGKTMPNCIIDGSKTKPKKKERVKQADFGWQESSTQQIWLFKRAEHGSHRRYFLCVSAATADRESGRKHRNHQVSK